MRPSTLLTVLTVLTASPLAACEVGETRWHGPQPFQKVSHEVWLYPHSDGVPELFVEGKGAWRGSLGSRFHPERGFANRFNAAEVANELAGADTPSADRRRAARLLMLYRALHPAAGSPSWLAPLEQRIERYGEPGDLEWAEARAEEQRRLLSGLSRVGTRVARAPARLRSAADHYAALLADGFLDVVVIGGNSKDSETAQRYGGRLLDALREELAGLGFRAQRERGAPARTLYERVVRIGKTRARVRLRIAGGSGRGDEERRAVAAFVEGLARADVLIYLGHSNKDSGAYYLSERKTPYSRFRLGLAAEGEDLERRCYGLGRKAHQVLSLQSCSSYEKYCRPIRAGFPRGPGRRPPGVVGTPDVAYFQDFVPRARAFLRLLLAGAGPRRIASRLNELKPMPDSPTQVLRGVLQPQHSFLLPRGVQRQGAIEELGPEDGFLALGQGSDGKRYPSTGVFPQDVPGEVVQVARAGQGLYGLYRDGELRWVGPDTGGAALPVAAARHFRLRFVAPVQLGRRAALVAIDERGRVLCLQGARARVARARPPRGVRFVALGHPREGEGPARAYLAARDHEGRTWLLRLGGAPAWRLHEEALPLAVSPSLLGQGVPAELRLE